MLGTSIYDAFAQVFALTIIALLTHVAWGVRKLLKKRRAPTPVSVEAAAETDRRINELLSHLRDRLDAQRAYLSRFHNGDHYVDNDELLRKTRTHEAVRDGVAYQAEYFKGMLLSSMQQEMELVIEEGHSYRLVRDLPRGKFKWLCLQAGAQAVARCAIRKGGKVIGFVGLDFDREECPEDIAILCEYAGRIETLL